MRKGFSFALAVIGLLAALLMLPMPSSAQLNRVSVNQIVGTTTWSPRFQALGLGAAAGSSGTLTFANGTVVQDSALGALAMVSSGAVNGIKIPNGSSNEYCEGCTWASNVAEYGVFTNGGTGRNLRIRGASAGGTSIIFNASGSDNFAVNSSGHFVAPSDNTYDIGATGATRPRTVYAGTSYIGPLFRSDSAKVLLQGTGTGATQVAATQTTAPTCSSNCGTSPSVVGTDTAGIITMGATGSPASGFVLTFNGTWAAAPACTLIATKSGMAAGKAPIVVVSATGTLTVTTNGTAPANGDTYAYQCFGTQ